MGSIFSPPKPQPLPPAPDPLPPPPERSDAETERLADEQRKLAYKGNGRASTFLTPGGTTESSSAVRFLGGSART